jgi:Mg2+/Co2+ transporter CorB
MVHRMKMISVCVDNAAEEVVKSVLECSVTRVPLWSGRPENIIGIVHAKDLLRAIRAAGDDLAKVDVKTIAAIRVAKLIIELAKDGERDPKKLCDRAVEILGN